MLATALAGVVVGCLQLVLDGGDGVSLALLLLFVLPVYVRSLVVEALLVDLEAATLVLIVVVAVELLPNLLLAVMVMALVDVLLFGTLSLLVRGVKDELGTGAGTEGVSLSLISEAESVFFCLLHGGIFFFGLVLFTF